MKMRTPSLSGETNPIKPNLLDAQMNVTSVLTSSYKQKTMNGPNENKPNQTQFQASPRLAKCKKSPAAATDSLSSKTAPRRSGMTDTRRSTMGKEDTRISMNPEQEDFQLPIANYRFDISFVVDSPLFIDLGRAVGSEISVRRDCQCPVADLQFGVCGLLRGKE
jgi:hypothetical protein